MEALFLVDIQRDFCPGGALAVTDGDAVVPVANGLIADFSYRGLPVCASRDWHPAGHCSFASSHPGTKVGEVIEVAGLQQMLWPDHCVQGSESALFHPELDEDRITEVFDKGTDPDVDSYSAFFDNARRHDTGLAAWLRSQGIDTLTICGLATDYCVKYTALDARALGFSVRVVRDGCRAVEVAVGDGETALAELLRAGCSIL